MSTTTTNTNTIVIRFTGDSGDGMQLVGEQLTITAAQSGKEVRSKPDFPAEIRAPSGTLAGVSGFQIALSDKAIFTAGEELDVLVALNPAALKTALQYLIPGGLLIINEDSFQDKDWERADLSRDFLTQSASLYQLISLQLTSLTLQAIETIDIPRTQAKKAKNFYILGLVLWLFDLPLENCLAFIRQKFKNNPLIAAANEITLSGGYHYAMTQELSRQHFILGNVERATGDYRQITGIEAVGLSIAALSVGTNTPMLVSGYPITPASAILQECARMSQYGIELLQAEDEIAAICACIGASFGGSLALTCTSGPGLDLKSESLGLAVMTELPLVIIDVQRGGPSTGLPTKTEQSDLNQALYGRHGEAPLPVLAARSPSDCFYTIIEAFVVAIKYMTPVIVLMDASLANGAEPWKIPSFESLSLPEIAYNRFPKPYQRDALLARSWNLPGTPGLIHQIGGLEKEGEDGRVSYDAENHQKMINIRKNKIAGIAADWSLTLEGYANASIVLVGWGSTYGTLTAAVDYCAHEHIAVALLHLRHLNPLPQNLESLLKRFEKVLVLELNNGQLCQLIRGQFLINAQSINQCNGQTFSIDFIVSAIKKELAHDENYTNA